jgi:alkanesulfonate monooxygenase SsuD/methylene tetrahydromethanopterin reductase-like flavin-dependent oxidoreductase (luciferase family)
MNANPGAKLRFGLWYDFRNPPQWRRPYTEIYAETLDQIAWAEQNGFDDVWLQEHHFHEDGFSSSVMTIAAAIAARTRTIRIGTAVMLMPFHNPVRVAEDGATVDIISGGRFQLGIGNGYKVEEFESYGISRKERGGRSDEGLEIIRRLWEGETLTYKGKYYQVTNARLAPEPVQKPRPPLLVGGFSPAGVRRAAKYGDGFLGTGPIKELYDHYVAELRNLGKPTTNLTLGGGYFWLIASEDPEETWREAAGHILYQLNGYAEWFEKAGMPLLPRIRDAEHLRELGIFNVADPGTCIEMIRTYISEVPLTHFYSFTVPPGLPAGWVQPHLELFAKKVIPAFR